MKINIGLVDDHQLFLKSLSLMLQSFKNYEVIIEAENGKDLQQKINSSHKKPDMILLDVNMPIMNGIETATWPQQQYPTIKKIALSMNDDDKTIIGMIKAGCCGYLLKDTHPTEFEKALTEIYTKGYYNADSINVNYRRLLQTEQNHVELNLTEKEKIFITLSCSELTYKQIASQMNVSERTVDGYRESIFEKMKVQSRIGMVLEAIKKGLVPITITAQNYGN